MIIAVIRLVSINVIWVWFAGVGKQFFLCHGQWEVKFQNILRFIVNRHVYIVDEAFRSFFVVGRIIQYPNLCKRAFAEFDFKGGRFIAWVDVVDTFELIIPSIILIPGIICYIAYFFVNDAKIKSALKISSLCIAAFCVVFSVSFFAAVFVNSGSEKTSSYKEAAESKYSLGNFVDLSDYEAERSDNELYSNGFLSGYYTVDNYSKSDGSYNYYTATVYEYTGGTAASRKLIKKRLEKELLRETSVGGKSIKYTDGTEGDYRYKYCNYTDKFEMRSSSYFSIVAESSDKVTVYILNSDYKNHFGEPFDAEKIISSICS